MMAIEFEREDREGVTILKVNGALDKTTGGLLKNVLADLALEGRHEIVIDMAGVPRVNVNGVGTLLHALRRARRRGGDIRLACVNKIADQNIRHSGASKVFEMFKTVDQAVGSFAAKNLTAETQRTQRTT